MKNSTYSILIQNNEVNTNNKSKHSGGNKINFQAIYETAKIPIDDCLIFYSSLSDLGDFNSNSNSHLSLCVPSHDQEQEQPQQVKNNKTSNTEDTSTLSNTNTNSNSNPTTSKYREKIKTLILRQTIPLRGDDLVVQEIGRINLNLDKLAISESNPKQYSFEIFDENVRVTIIATIHHREVEGTPRGGGGYSNGYNGYSSSPRNGLSQRYMNNTHSLSVSTSHEIVDMAATDSKVTSDIDSKLDSSATIGPITRDSTATNDISNVIIIDTKHDDFRPIDQSPNLSSIDNMDKLRYQSSTPVEEIHSFSDNDVLFSHVHDEEIRLGSRPQTIKTIKYNSVNRKDPSEVEKVRSMSIPSRQFRPFANDSNDSIQVISENNDNESSDHKMDNNSLRNQSYDDVDLYNDSLLATVSIETFNDSGTLDHTLDNHNHNHTMSMNNNNNNNINPNIIPPSIHINNNKFNSNDNSPRNNNKQSKPIIFNFKNNLFFKKNKNNSILEELAPQNNEQRLKSVLQRVVQERDLVHKESISKSIKLSQSSLKIKSLKEEVNFLKSQIMYLTTSNEDLLERASNETAMKFIQSKFKPKTMLKTNNNAMSEPSSSPLLRYYLSSSQKSVSQFDLYVSLDSQLSSPSAKALAAKSNEMDVSIYNMNNNDNNNNIYNNNNEQTPRSTMTTPSHFKLKSLPPEEKKSLRKILSSLKDSNRRNTLASMQPYKEKLNHTLDSNNNHNNNHVIIINNNNNVSITTDNEEISLYMLVNPQIELPSDLMEWEFDVLLVTDGLRLCNIIGKIFDTTFNLQELGVDQTTLARFILETAKKYHDRPFHNLQHATCVTHMTMMLIRETRASDNLKPYQLFGILVGAFVHDVDHPGNTNLFEINTQSELALRYNDQSVLENHHCSTAFTIMNHRNTQILSNFPKLIAKEIRRLIICCVLATDISVHIDLIDSMKLVIEHGWNFNETKDQEFLGKMLVHAADLSNPVRPFHMARKWAERISIEFNEQVEKEQSLGIPILGFMVTPDEKTFCKNESGFAAFVVAPMWRGIAQLYPNLAFLVDQLD
eukprot:gene15053-20254_t